MGRHGGSFYLKFGAACEFFRLEDFLMEGVSFLIFFFSQGSLLVYWCIRYYKLAIKLNSYQQMETVHINAPLMSPLHWISFFRSIQRSPFSLRSNI